MEYNTTLTGNIITNSRRGIYLQHANYNIMFNDIVENCTEGIRLRNSSNNLIYHNNFINNENQAYDNRSNQWDNGYPSGGNYWGDYAGEDIDNDGMGDTPYIIPSDNNQDRYPLMNLFVPEAIPSEEAPPTRWPLIAGVVGIIAIIGIVAALYMRRRKPRELSFGSRPN
ncbi:hypothetical protein ES703_51412 [subsurface metagenome]